jgi:hypothetical protein
MAVFKKIILGIFSVTAVCGIIYSQQSLNMQQAIFDANLIQVKKPINANLIKPFLFGHEAFYADLFWIDSIRWSVERGMPGIGTYLYKTLDMVTDLDPRFEQAYVWSSSAITFSVSSDMSYKERVIAANKILQKGWDYIQNDTEGWRHFSHYWMIPQLLAFNYGFELKDKDKALEYNQALMNVPDLPPHLKTWVAGLYRESDAKEKGLGFLEELLAVETLQAQMRMTDDDEVKERLRGKLIAFYNKLNTKEYGDQQILRIQQQVRELVAAWRSEYEFIPFSMYILMHDREKNSSTDGMYEIFFPNLM